MLLASTSKTAERQSLLLTNRPRFGIRMRANQANLGRKRGHRAGTKQLENEVVLIPKAWSLASKTKGFDEFLGVQVSLPHQCSVTQMIHEIAGFPLDLKKTYKSAHQWIFSAWTSVHSILLSFPIWCHSSSNSLVWFDGFIQATSTCSEVMWPGFL